MNEKVNDCKEWFTSFAIINHLPFLGIDTFLQHLKPILFPGSSIR